MGTVLADHHMVAGATHAYPNNPGAAKAATTRLCQGTLESSPLAVEPRHVRLNHHSYEFAKIHFGFPLEFASSL